MCGFNGMKMAICSAITAMKRSFRDKCARYSMNIEKTRDCG